MEMKIHLVTWSDYRFYLCCRFFTYAISIQHSWISRSTCSTNVTITSVPDSSRRGTCRCCHHSYGPATETGSERTTLGDVTTTPSTGQGESVIILSIHGEVTPNPGFGNLHHLRVAAFELVGSLTRFKN